MSSKSWLVCLLALLGASPAVAADSLEMELVRIAPRVIGYLKENHYSNVGVLKFLISRDGKPFRDNVGTLNVLLARRLEVALVLANDPRKPLHIIDNATVVAHRIPGANHRTPEGRLKLFDALYPLPVGDQQVKPDVFVTGIAMAGGDLKTLHVSLLAFDKTQNEMKEIAEFQAALRPELLVEIGESFMVRGFFGPEPKKTEPEPKKTPEPEPKKTPEPMKPDEEEMKKQREAEKKKDEAVRQNILARKQGKVLSPAADPNAYVKLKIYYDNRLVPLEVRDDNTAWVPEPQPGQKVRLVLQRDDSNERYGIVLKVNGQNTIEKQQQPDLLCRRWILDKGDPPLTIRGFQITDEKMEEFAVLSAQESKKDEINYGSDVGQITLTVYRQREGQPRKPAPSYEAKEAQAVASATMEIRKDNQVVKAENWEAKKEQFLRSSNRTRGLMVGGKIVSGNVQRVEFEPDPTPIMSLVVVYYNPRTAPPK